MRPLYFRFKRFPQNKIDWKSLKSIFWQYLRMMGPFPISFLTIPNNFQFSFFEKTVYLTLIRSPLWSLVKSEKNMLGPIFDFWNLPDLSSMAGRDSHGELSLSGRGTLALWRGSMPWRDTSALWRGSMPV